MTSTGRRQSSSLWCDVLRWIFLPLREAFSLQFIAAAVWLFVCSVWNCMVQVYIDRLYAQQHFGDRQWEPLPDIGFALLPYIKEPHLADQWQTFILGSTFVSFMLLHPQRIKIIKRFCAVQGSVFLLRSITIGATLLPNPYSHCVNEHRHDENVVLEALAVMGGTRATCGDVLFSGHAANITIMELIWNEYCRYFLPPRAYVTVRSTGMWNAKRRTGFNRDYLACAAWLMGYFLPKVLCPILALVGYLIVISTHFHYTVDVLVGIFVASKMWRLYHMEKDVAILADFNVIKEATSELRRLRKRRKRGIFGDGDGGASTSTAATASDRFRSVMAARRLDWSSSGESTSSGRCSCASSMPPVARRRHRPLVRDSSACYACGGVRSPERSEQGVAAANSTSAGI
ncbi:sphingomyelin synthase [Perkinsus chesapeaki]|uniref:Sphingomyelin synthase n=1 Tax=Perkinsus chesapeaki TaxID=330153 RepID=A0A7J6MQ78_PERCH|nr:sphingomyelin synthase [Perkinsus chesapeaki]